jgi:hypothetical protein
MKIRSLLLGSIAVAGLSTGAYAADLGVLTSLDVCDQLGISGLTISSDTNCLQLSGGVQYTFTWGDFRGNSASAVSGGPLQVIGRVPAGEKNYTPGTIDTITAGSLLGRPDSNMDWTSGVLVWLTAVATSDSDFGPAKAVITLKQDTIPRYFNEAFFDNDGDAGSNGTGTGALDFEEAYVAVGDSTVLMAGRRADALAGSVANVGDDAAYNFLGLFGTNKVDGGGVLIESDDNRFGHESIQVVSDLGNGFSVAAGLENIAGTELNTPTVLGTPANDVGTLVGTVQYAVDGISAHVTGGAFGVLDSNISEWFVHAGASGTFDAFKLRAAAAYTNRNNDPILANANAFHGMITGSATFDMFTIALSGEYARQETAGLGVNNGFGVGGSIGAKVTDTVAINLGARYFDGAYQYANPGQVGTALQSDDDLLQIAIQAVASLSETITLTGEIGGYFNGDRNYSFDAAAGKNVWNNGLYYGALAVAWAPSKDFSTSLKGEVNTQGAYRTTVTAKKTFE